MDSSFKIILILFLALGCGVKSDPVPPPGTAIPSYESQFLQVPDTTKDQNKKKKSESN